jgi:alcohol dehydrogenase class IV
MQSFHYVAPGLRIYAGKGSLEQIGRELDRLGCRRAVVFCGATLGSTGSPLDQLLAAVGERCVGVFAGVRAHSPLPAVQEGAAELDRLGADSVIAVGGGSAVVSARAAAILLAERADVHTLCTSFDAKGVMRSPRLAAAKLPQLVVPTTPNTAIVKAGSAVLDPVSGERLALFDPKTRAQALFLHPALLGSAPAELAASASLDTLTLAIEGLISLSSHALSDAALMHSVRLLIENLATGRPEGLQTRSELVLAAVLCGQGTDSTGAGMATVLGHAVGGRFGAENGVVKAIVLPHVLRFNSEAAGRGLGRIAAALGLQMDPGAPAVEEVNSSLRVVFAAQGVPERLRDAAIPREELPAIAARGMRDWFLRGNPRPVREPEELLHVLEQAW